MESYIVINGKKAPLSEEQLKMLGITTEKKSPFTRCEEHESYYLINSIGSLDIVNETGTRYDRTAHLIANYCTDKNLMQQRAWRETLNRLLWRYAMEHDGEGNFEICHNGDAFLVQNCGYKYLGQSFSTRTIAENAITEIIQPFMKEHPDFVW